MSLSPLLQLPSEIWEIILGFLPNSLLQRTTTSLLEILPNASRISIHHQFKHLAIHSDQELSQLLHHSQDQVIQHIPQSFSLHAWKLIHYNVLINLINQLSSNIKFIQLNIGPVFSPDQLEELFFNPKPKLHSLCLRFNQNVSRRSYEPFLKGSYFDNCCDLLAKWPTSQLCSLSFVQDLPPPYQKSHLINQAIAQPIILFKFWCITNLATSPVGQNLSNLRLRIPNRDLTTSLTNNTTKFELVKIGEKSFKLPINPFPNLKLLDLSTSFIPSIASVLKKFPRLEYLILDRTQLITPSRFEGDEERLNESLQSIGWTASSSGISCATEISRIWRDLKKMIETELRDEKLRSNGMNTQDIQINQLLHNNDTRLITPVREEQSSRRRGRSSFASAPRWKSKKNTSSAGNDEHTTTTAPIDWKINQVPLSQQAIPTKVTILPSPSKLISFCCGTDLNTSSKAQDQDPIRDHWEDQFQIGWQAGLDKLQKVMDEKLLEFGLSVEIWKKSVHELDAKKGKAQTSVAKNRAGGQYDLLERELEEELDRLMRSRPVLLVQQTTNNGNNRGADEDAREDKQSSSGIFERFKQKMGLREILSSELEAGLVEKMMAWEKERQVEFCTWPDCASVGRVVWTAQKPIQLITKHTIDLLHGHPTPEEEDNDELSGGFGQLHLSQSGSNTPLGHPPARPLHPPCAHLVARKVWDLDSF